MTIKRYWCDYGSMIPDEEWHSPGDWVRYSDHASLIETYRQRDEAHQEQVREAYHRQRDAEERVAVLEEALAYCVKQIPELGDVPGVRAALQPKTEKEG